MGLVATGTVDEVVKATEEEKKQCADGRGKDYSMSYCNGKIKCCEVGGCERYGGIAKTTLAGENLPNIERQTCTKPYRAEKRT